MTLFNILMLINIRNILTFYYIKIRFKRIYKVLLIIVYKENPIDFQEYRHTRVWFVLII